MTLSQRLGVVEIVTLPFANIEAYKYSFFESGGELSWGELSLGRVVFGTSCLDSVSFPRLSGTGMTSLTLSNVR